MPSRKSAVTATRAEVVAAELRRMIRAGELAGGERLRQMEIAEQFGVSTTPVREAFTALSREGLVRQDAHRGVIVFRASRDALRENYLMRMALEPLAAEEAASLMDAEDIAAIRSILKRMEEVGASSEEYPSLNARFHSRIYLAADLPRLAEMIGSLREAANSYIVLLLSDNHLPDSYLRSVQREHATIVKALKRQDREAAGAAVKSHLQHNLDQMMKVLDTLPAE